MNGTDPTPQDVALENGFFSKHQVKVFAYNQQVVDSLTESIRANAQTGRACRSSASTRRCPLPATTYQSWMLAETNAIAAAVVARHLDQHL